jgi:hypothetical protein
MFKKHILGDRGKASEKSAKQSASEWCHLPKTGPTIALNCCESLK